MKKLVIRAITFTTVFSAAHMAVPASRYDRDTREWKFWDVEQDEDDGSVWMRHKKKPVCVRVPEQVCIIEYDEGEPEPEEKPATKSSLTPNSKAKGKR